MWRLLILLFTTLGVMDEEALSQHMLTPLFFPSHVRCLRDTPASLCLETVPLYQLPLCLNVSSNRHGSVSRGFHISHPLRCFLGFGRGADRLQGMICVENGYGDEEEEEGSRWWWWGRVIHDNMGLQWGLLLPLPVPAAPAVSGNTGRMAGGIIYHIFSSSFHFLQYFTHPPFSKTPALAVIHAPSFISIFSGCSSGLWQISISIVRPGKEPNGPYRHFLCSWSPLSLCTGRGGSFLPLFVWFLSALCVFVCVSWWSFFPPWCGNSEVSVTSLWSLLATGSLHKCLKE